MKRLNCKLRYNRVMDSISSVSELREHLNAEAEEQYRLFSQKLTPTKYRMVGVRIPKIRKMVGLVSRDCYDVFLRMKPKTFEEVLARGMIICKMSYDEMLQWFDSQVDYIDNWCTCDIFCSGLRKVISRRKDEFLENKVGTLLKNNDEFAVRVGLVILKCAYAEVEYLNLIFEKVESVASRDEYYIKMAIAWLLSECFIKYPSATTGYLVDSKLPEWTFKKTISKICDSYRVDDETKKMLRKMSAAREIIIVPS